MKVHGLDIGLSYIFYAKNRFSNADRQKPISDS